MESKEEIQAYRKRHGCSLREAHAAITRHRFAVELRQDRDVSDLADTLLRILDFEFGGYSE